MSRIVLEIRDAPVEGMAFEVVLCQGYCDKPKCCCVALQAQLCMDGDSFILKVIVSLRCSSFADSSRLLFMRHSSGAVCEALVR